jgi:2-oxoisovalerate dehydrogenase E2 component (dihydrolipoyl transacylase)
MGRYVFKLPDVGEGTAEAELVAWHIKPGDLIEEDQHIVDVMTDKATVEIPAPAPGKVLSVTGAPGEMLAVGAAILVLEVDGPGNAEADEAEVLAAPRLAAPEQPKAVSAAPVKNKDAPLGTSGGNYVFKLPDIGEGTAEAELVAWHVKPGDMVTEDQHIVDVMTDKATVEIPSPAAGKVISTRGTPGQMLAVGSEILVLQVEGPGNIDAVLPQQAPSSPKPAPQAARSPPPKAASPAAKPLLSAAGRTPAAQGATKPGFATRTPGEKPIASPAVRRRAWEAGVELQFVPGTGPGGRISQSDLDAYIASGGTIAQVLTLRKKSGTEDIKVIGLRRTIAMRMQDAKRRIPHFSYIEEVDVTELEELRAKFNARWGKTRGKLTLLPFLAKAMINALSDYPQINARFHDDDGFVRRYEGVHLGIAAQTPTGLVMPVIQHAEALTLWECAAEIARLASAAREGKATRDELSGSTISITSLGALGGVATTPVINYPEVAIVGVNKILERPMVQDGKIVIRKMMNLSSSFDHRVVDGWHAAEFVQQIRAQLETPAMLLVD